jgi:hypothetical protein
MLIWFTVICLEINEIDHFKDLIFLRIHKSDKLNKSRWHFYAHWREIWQKCDISLFPMLIWFTVISLEINEIDHFKGLIFLRIHKSDQLNISKCHLSAYWKEIWHKCDIFWFPMLIWFTVICLKINEIDHLKGLIFLWVHKSDKLNKSRWHFYAHWREIWQKCDIFTFPMLIWFTTVVQS